MVPVLSVGLFLSAFCPPLQVSMGPDQTEPEVPADAVGRRVSCGTERGTVQYVGPVPPTAGESCLSGGHFTLTQLVIIPHYLLGLCFPPSQ